MLKDIREQIEKGYKAKSYLGIKLQARIKQIQKAKKIDK